MESSPSKKLFLALDRTESMDAGVQLHLLLLHVCNFNSISKETFSSKSFAFNTFSLGEKCRAFLLDAAVKLRSSSLLRVVKSVWKILQLEFKNNCYIAYLGGGGNKPKYIIFKSRLTNNKIYIILIALLFRLTKGLCTTFLPKPTPPCKQNDRLGLINFVGAFRRAHLGAHVLYIRIAANALARHPSSPTPACPTPDKHS